MRTCPSCGKEFAEVQGASEQSCPHCGFIVPTPSAVAPSVEPPAGPVDAFGAAAHAVRLWLRHPLALLALWLPVVLANGAVSIMLVLYAESTGIPTDPFAMNDPQRLRYLGVALPLAGVAFAIELAAWGAVAAFVARKESTASGAPLSAATLLGLGFLLTFAYVAGFALLVVPFFIFFHWFLHAPAAAGDGATLTRALERSRVFARERRTYGFTALVLLVWVAIWLIELVLANGFASFLGLFGVPAGYADALGPVLAAWPLAPLIPLFPAAYWSLAKRAAPDADPPAPNAPAAERFRTTKCPKCATLVPYTATGQPVDITCPVCGTKGKAV